MRALGLVYVVLQYAQAIVTDVIGSPLEHPAEISSTATEFTATLTLSRYQYNGPNGLQQFTRSVMPRRVRPNQVNSLICANP